jgi:peptidoglycan L-alanyl-D-glutamate endopeptidase CwlK
MPEFSKASLEMLDTCDERLIKLALIVVAQVDCTVLCGYRGEADQNEAFRTGRSKLVWPFSKHNVSPSLAIDLAPYPIDWTDRERFYYFAGFVLGVAYSIDFPLRYGGDWDSDMDPEPGDFDLVHFELEEG